MTFAIPLKFDCTKPTEKAMESDFQQMTLTFFWTMMQSSPEYRTNFLAINGALMEWGVERKHQGNYGNYSIKMTFHERTARSEQAGRSQ